MDSVAEVIVYGTASKTDIMLQRYQMPAKDSPCELNLTTSLKQ